MLLRGSLFIPLSSILIFLLLVFLTNAASSQLYQLSSLQQPQPTSNPFPNTLTKPSHAHLTHRPTDFLYTRGHPRSHTIANGWRLHYQVLSLLYPTIPALLELRTFYHNILAEMDYRMLVNDPTTTLSELSFGEYTMQFMAERGFGMPLHWEIIESFVETLLQGTVPMTFMAHIAPPGSDVGVSVRMWVGKHRR
ncbi:MAG: hypothetical protein Q9208_001053 [Pyrenodesmia sp. 3 TL-2023]